MKSVTVNLDRYLQHESIMTERDLENIPGHNKIQNCNKSYFLTFINDKLS